MDWIGIPTPFRIASNGIALQNFNNIEKEWFNLFENQNVSRTVYHIIARGFRQCKWVENESGSIFESLVAFFDQIIGHVKDEYAAAHQLLP